MSSISERLYNSEKELFFVKRTYAKFRRLQLEEQYRLLRLENDMQQLDQWFEENKIYLKKAKNESKQIND